MLGTGFRFSSGAGPGRSAQRHVDACARFRADVDAGDARAVARARSGAGAGGIDRRRRSRGPCRRHQGGRDPGLDPPAPADTWSRAISSFIRPAWWGRSARRSRRRICSSSTPARLANAIGIATSRCGSLTSNTGTMTKSTHCGYAASLGLESALLAASGFTGDEQRLRQPDAAMPRHFCRPISTATCSCRSGRRSGWSTLAYTLKIFPCKFTTHYGITAALAARPKHSVTRRDPRRAHAGTRRSHRRPAASPNRARRQIQRAIHAGDGARSTAP